MVSVEPPCARHAPQLTSHPWRAPRAPRARAYADGRRRCPCRRRAWRRARRGRPAAGAGGRARRGRPPVRKTRPFQPASLFPRSQLAEAGRPSELPRAHPLALANPARRDSGRTLVAGVFPQVPHVLPASKSMISVESMTVCSRWAMVSTVHSSKALRMAVCSTASVSLSMEAW